MIVRKTHEVILKHNGHCNARLNTRGKWTVWKLYVTMSGPIVAIKITPPQSIFENPTLPKISAPAHSVVVTQDALNANPQRRRPVFRVILIGICLCHVRQYPNFH